MSEKKPGVDSVKLYRIRKLLAELSTKEGRGTELVSLYVPAKKPLHEVSAALREEYGTASNIKSDSTRDHVLDALTRTMQRLKLHGRTPENGLAIFCGALPTNGPGSETIFLYDVLPHKPVQNYLYRCDDHFHIEPLQEMLTEQKVIGILSIDASEAGIGIVSGNSFEVVEVLSSGVSGKHRAGGQSARRFERLREMELNDFFNRVARHAVKILITDHGVESLIVSGPGPTKQDFLKNNYLDYRLQKSVLGVVDVSYAGSEGVRETLEKSGELLQEFRLTEERRLVQRFLKDLNSQSGLVVYSLPDTLKGLEGRNADLVLVADDLDQVRLTSICKNCKTKKYKTVSRREYMRERQSMKDESCAKCGTTDYDIEDRDMIEYLADLAVEGGARIEVISGKTEDGNMLKSFGGVGVFLRYRSSA